MRVGAAIVCAVLLSAPTVPAWSQAAGPPRRPPSPPSQHESVSPPPPVDSNPVGSPTADPLAPGDAIQLAFWREPQLGGDFPVDETGSVVLPLIGVRTVTRLTPEQLKAALLAD